MRIIPGKTKIKIELFKGISLTDFLIGLLFAGIVLLVVTSQIAGKLYYAFTVLILGIMLLVKTDEEPNYMFFLSVLRYGAYRKTFSKNAGGRKDIGNINAFTKIEDSYIVYEDYYGAAIEIPPVEFRFFSPYRRRMSIDECLAGALRGMHGGYAANLVKIERRVPYDSYIGNELEKLDELRRCFECAMISEEEFQAKTEVIFDRINELERMNSQDRVVAPFYYLVLFESDKNQLRLHMDSVISTLQRGEMKPKRLNSKELALFLKYSNDIDFDEKELDGLDEKDYADWAMPESLRVKTKNCIINDITAYTMAVSNYPLRVGDAWLASVMSIPATKVVVKLQPMDKSKTVRNIDRSISELRSRYSHSGVDSTRIELADHIQSLGELLSMLQSDNEVLLNTDIFVTCYDVQQTKKEGREEAIENTSRVTINNMREVIRRTYREAELRLSGLKFNQMEGFIGSQISGYDPLVNVYGRGLPSTTAAAMYPWVFAHVQDPKGIKLGSEDGIPVFIDMFRRDSERVNSNVVIVGKTGSGKSYATKSILVNLAADNSKIFVLDPENEYSELAENLHGKFINVGNAQQGRMNPFQIITALDDDETGDGITGSYSAHLQFLEEFFKQILPDCEKDALEYLNTLTDRVYMNMGITAETNLSMLKPEDYPTFSDLYDEIMRQFQTTENGYLRTILRTLMNYVSKFATGGRNANMWNGPSTVTTDENFTVFNFQSLLAGGNKTVTNAQMLLVMKYIDNEIIKNREYNNRYGTNRKIVVVIDEAHVFIDEKYPVALDFMFQLAKRIRKYNGMQIVITQNIKDFVGSEEISRKSSAIINACQYSFIFPLAPNDMSDLCKLYEKAGGINENEQDKIVTAPRGNAFVILSPTSRSSFQIDVPDDVVQVFETRGLGTRYFANEDGEAEWEEFVGGSREKYLSNRKNAEQPETVEEAERMPKVTFVEVSEEEYERELQELNKAKTESSAAVSFEEIPAADYSPNQRNVEEYNRESVVTEKPAAAEPKQADWKTAAESDKMEMMFTEFRRTLETMSRFSYDAIVNDIMGRLNAQNVAAAPVQAAPIAERVTADEAKDEEAPEPVTGIFGLFSDEVEADTPAEEETKSEAESDEDQSLLDYLRMVSQYEDNTAPIISEDNTWTNDGFTDMNNSGVDVMALLEKAAERMEKISVLDDMKSVGDELRHITLEELIKVNENRKNR